MQGAGGQPIRLSGKFSPFPFWISPLDEVWYSDPGGKWDAWASDHLASFGSHLHGKFSLLQFITFALLFTSIKGLDSSDCWSVSWRFCRISMSQQNILDELSSSLFDQVQVYTIEMLSYFGDLEKVSNYRCSLLCDGEGSSFVSAAFLEAGIVEYKYGRVDASRLHLDNAQEACGLHLSLTGTLGFQTIHQVDAKSQMVLVAKTNKPAADEGQSTELTGPQSDGVAFRNMRSSVPSESDEFCDILRIPRLAQNGNDPSSESMTSANTQISLTAIPQPDVLAQCLHVSRRSRSDEMSSMVIFSFLVYIARYISSILHV